MAKDVGHGLGFRLVRCEDAVQAGDVQHLAYLWRGGADGQAAAGVAHPRQQPHQQTNAAAVDKLNAAKVQDDVRALGGKIDDVLLQRRQFPALDDAARTGDHRNASDGPVMKGERHRTS